MAQATSGLRSLFQEAILDIKKIRVSYLRTWFIPDVIAAFPIGYILLFAVIRLFLLFFFLLELPAIYIKTKKNLTVFAFLGPTLPQRWQPIQGQQDDEDTDVRADPQLDPAGSSVQIGQVLQRSWESKFNNYFFFFFFTFVSIQGGL